MTYNKVVEIEYEIFLDTNQIEPKSHSNQKMEDTLRSLKAIDSITANIWLVSIVKQEWQKHLTSLIEQVVVGHSKRSSQLQELGIEVSQLEGEVDFDQICSQIIEKNKIKTLEPAYKQVPVEDLTKRALAGEPPFDPKKQDRGLKDAVIAHTVIQFAKTKPKKNVIFLTHDNPLGRYVQELSEKRAIPNLYVTESPPDLEDYFARQKAHLDKEVSEEARVLFFKKNDFDTLYYKWDIVEHAKQRYNLEFPSADEIKEAYRKSVQEETALSRLLRLDSGIPASALESDWENIGGEFRVSRPIFIQKKDGKLHWESSVIYLVTYELPSTAVNASVEGAGVTHTVEYTVSWQTTVSKSNPLSRPKLKQIKKRIDTLDYSPVSTLPSFALPTLNPRYTNLSTHLRETMQQLSKDMTTASGLATTSVSTPKLPTVSLAKFPKIPKPDMSADDIQSRIKQSWLGGASPLPKAPQDRDSNKS